jgi:5-methylcytosine-specific restriction endonuclease McrA
MKNTICDAGEIWKQFEDLLVPRLGLSVVDRAAYSHLLRHSRLEGKVRLQFSILWLARGIGVSGGPTRNAVRRLVNYGALRLVERNKCGHLVDVRLPEEICAVREHEKGAGLPAAAGDPSLPNGDTTRPNTEETDFTQTRALRQSIHARERGLCFYCLRGLTSAMRCLDHVAPRAQSGCSSYRNLVSCCLECNSRKGETPAGDFLRWLFREGRLTPDELTDRLRALEDLASGKLLPALVEAGFSPSFFPPGAQSNSAVTPSTDGASVSTTTLAEMERMTILRVFEQARGDKALAGKMLGISRATLYRKLKRYNIPMKGAADDVAAEPQPLS